MIICYLTKNSLSLYNRKHASTTKEFHSQGDALINCLMALFALAESDRVQGCEQQQVNKRILLGADERISQNILKLKTLLDEFTQ